MYKIKSFNNTVKEVSFDDLKNIIINGERVGDVIPDDLLVEFLEMEEILIKPDLKPLN